MLVISFLIIEHLQAFFKDTHCFNVTHLKHQPRTKPKLNYKMFSLFDPLMNFKCLKRRKDCYLCCFGYFWQKHKLILKSFELFIRSHPETQNFCIHHDTWKINRKLSLEVFREAFSGGIKQKLAQYQMKTAKVRKLS